MTARDLRGKHAKCLCVVVRASGHFAGGRLMTCASRYAGVIVGESETAVRIRVGEGWDMDVFKHMILAVEQDHWASVVVN